MTPKMDRASPLVWLVILTDLFLFIYLFIYFCSFQQIDLDVNSSFYYQQDIDGGKCECPPGFKGDGVKSCKGKRC